MHKLHEYEYEFRPGTGTRALILLHGTGGDETQMLPLAEKLDSAAPLVALRGNVNENGMLRFFKRHEGGVLDRADLKKRSGELALFIEATREKHNLGEIVGVGFSNGANILVHLIATNPSLLRGAILLRPMSAALPDATADLAGFPAFIAAGEEDDMVPLREAKQLESVLRAAGAWVEMRVSSGGHSLVDEDIERAREWLEALQ
jgi:phospholipase/carboxylesterase